MFNSHLYPAFDSVATLQNRRNDKRASKLFLWRDSLVDKTIKLPDLPEGRRWSDVSALKKLSYLPTRISRLTGLRNHLETKANIIIPSAYHKSIKDRNKFFYLIPRNVTITYGPYHYLGILDYRLERLHGLQTTLKLAGANVHLRAVQHINHVTVRYLDKDIFSCKITDLHHGGNGDLDQLCYDAAVAFAKRSRKVLLHIKHKYKFDQEKDDLLFKDCPCRRDGTRKDDEEESEIEFDDEIHGENDFQDHLYNYHDYFHEEEEGERSDDLSPTKHLQRIYFQPLERRRLMSHPYPEEEQEVAEEIVRAESEFGGEDDGSVDDGPKGGSLIFGHHDSNINHQGQQDLLSVERAYNRLRV